MASRRNPYPVLIAAALVPALALGGLWRYAGSQEPDVAAVSVSDTTVPEVLPTVLATPILSVRRAPEVLARDVNASSFTTALQPFAQLIDSTSCFAVSIDGEPFASVNESLSLRPASNVKLITASVALEVLGPEFTYTTTVNGTVDSAGVVQGDLYFVGGGDPVLNSIWWQGPNQKYPPFNNTSMEALADAVVAAGVTSVTGAVIGDASRYDSEWYAPSWADDVRFVEGGPVSALLVNDSRETATKSSNDPVVGAATVLTTLLAERGVTVAGKPAAGIAPDGQPIVASITSKPLPDLLAEMLTTSDNSTAEMVLKEIGLEATGSGTREAGLGVVNRTLESWGVPMDGVALVDGSGLSDDDRLTCGAILSVLQHGSVSDAVGQGLAIGGVAGGTLYDSFKGGEPLSGIIRAKTGTLYNYDDGKGLDGKPAAKALSGYVPTDGGVIEFSLLLNGPEIAEPIFYQPFWNQMAAIFADYPSGPSAADLSPR